MAGKLNSGNVFDSKLRLHIGSEERTSIQVAYSLGIYTYTHTHIHIYTHTYTHIHTYTYTHTQYTHVHIYTCTHVNMYTYTHSHIHTIQIFTGGNKNEHGVGSGTAIYKQNKLKHQMKQKLHDRYSNNQADQMAIVQALQATETIN